jgi:hypothetical protein
MNAKELLDHLTIPTPCPMDWNRMTGDDRVRHCESCGKPVYNISRMTDAAPFLVLANEQELCGRVTLGADGILLISDGQTGSQQPSRRWQFRIRSFMALIAGVAATLGFARLFPPPDEAPNLPAPQQNAWSGPKNLILMGQIVPRRDLTPAAPDVPYTSY